jgi:hypothetical protein
MRLLLEDKWGVELGSRIDRSVANVPYSWRPVCCLVCKMPMPKCPGGREDTGQAAAVSQGLSWVNIVRGAVKRRSRRLSGSRRNKVVCSLQGMWPVERD